MNNQALLLRTMVELADSLVDDFDVVGVLDLLTHRCVEILDVSAAGIMLGPSAESLRVMSSSSEAMKVLELFELQTDDGPCLDCFRSGSPVTEADLGVGRERWPRFAPRALRAGFSSADALPLRLRGTMIGVLNLFRAEPGASAPEDLAAAQALADVATIAILQYRVAQDASVLNEQLQHALSSRVAIEQAKGILAERGDVSMEEAFERLRTYGRSHNRNLTETAHLVVSGALPGTLAP